MIIELKKFGTALISRQAGKEALAAFRPTLSTVGPDEIATIDFDGVVTFSPSWGDEFLTILQREFGDRLMLKASDNPSVKMTLEILEKTNEQKFKRA